MIDYQNFKILHPHGHGWVEMHQEHHDPAQHDPEREWAKGARTFKCDTCEERIVIIPPNDFEPEER